jgi:hypothetical protein
MTRGVFDAEGDRSLVNRRSFKKKRFSFLNARPSQDFPQKVNWGEWITTFETL